MGVVRKLSHGNPAGDGLKPGRRWIMLSPEPAVPDPVDAMLTEVLPAQDWVPWEQAQKRLAGRMVLDLKGDMAGFDEYSGVLSLWLWARWRADWVLVDAVDRGAIRQVTLPRRRGWTLRQRFREWLSAARRRLATGASQEEKGERALIHLL